MFRIEENQHVPRPWEVESDHVTILGMETVHEPVHAQHMLGFAHHGNMAQERPGWRGGNGLKWFDGLILH